MSLSKIKNKKLIIYIDQNVVSNITKSHLRKDLERYEFFENLIKNGIRHEKMMIAISLDHYREFANYDNEQMRKQGLKKMNELSPIQFNEMSGIIKNQALIQYETFCGGGEGGKNHIFNRNPNERIRGMVIEAISWEKVHDNRKLETQQGDDVIVKTWNSIRVNKIEQDITFNDFYQEEMKAWQNIIIQNILYSPFNIMEKLPENIDNFLISEYFKNIPYIDIHLNMLTHLFVKLGKKRRIKKGDHVDIQRASTALPYVDVFVTDKTMAHVIIDLKLDEKYNVDIYSTQDKQIDKLNEDIAGYMENSEPLYITSVSIFIKLQLKKIEFKKLENLKNSLLSQDVDDDIDICFYIETRHREEYIEQFGEMEYNRLIMILGGMDMFNGDINLIDIVDDKDLIEKINNICDSEQYIIMKKAKKIPNNFIETLLAYCEEDKKKILEYNINKLEIL